MKVHAEIEYDTKEGGVHSDICPPNCSQKGLNDPDYREFLHKCLDEYLDDSGGTGGFYIKAEDHYFDFNEVDHLVIAPAIEGYAEIFMNDRKIGHISTIMQLQDVRVQLKNDKNYTGGCYIKWFDHREEFKIEVNQHGNLSEHPKGFFDKFDILLDELIGI